MSTEVERIYSELISIKALVEGSPSDIVAFEAIAAKSMLLATASYFEKAVCEIIKNYAKSVWDSMVLISFLDKQALYGKYHSLFDWNSSNINKFIKLFGNEFYQFIEPSLTEDHVKAAIKEFMLLGRLRNDLVHNNFSEYPMQFTSKEIKTKFNIAFPLIRFLAESLTKFEQ